MMDISKKDLEVLIEIQQKLIERAVDNNSPEEIVKNLVDDMGKLKQLLKEKK